MTRTNRLDRLLNTTRPWVTDGGLETDIIFNAGIDLPLFASFHLLETADGRAALAAYFNRYIDIARTAGTGFILDTATWRTSAPWGAQLGRSSAEMETILRRTVEAARMARDGAETATLPIMINGVVGPAGDGYAPEDMLTPDASERHHAPQIETMWAAGVDMVSAITMTHSGEAIGIAKAAAAVDAPVVISFTVETDGRLPSGETVAEAIDATENATGGTPVYYMINCAHPDHFAAILDGAPWTKKIGGIRANASRLSHAELDEAETLNDGNPQEFGALYGMLAERLPNLRVIGGCCGTDHRHIGCAAHHVVKSDLAA